MVCLVPIQEEKYNQTSFFYKSLFHCSHHLQQEEDIDMCKSDDDYTSFLRKRRNSLLQELLASTESLLEASAHHKKQKVQHHIKKSVKFASEHPVRCTTYEFTPEDITNSWYNKVEYASFIDDCKTEIEKAKSGLYGSTFKAINQNIFCSPRGLEEHIIPRFTVVKKQRRRGLIKMILQQQEMQKYGVGGFDHDSNRSISVLFSDASTEWAADLAAQDEAFVKRIVSSSS
jgi:hypothetical protein